MRYVTLKHKSLAFDCAGFLIICYFYDYTTVTRTLVAKGVKLPLKGFCTEVSLSRKKKFKKDIERQTRHCSKDISLKIRLREQSDTTGGGHVTSTVAAATTTAVVVAVRYKSS